MPFSVHLSRGRGVINMKNPGELLRRGPGISPPARGGAGVVGAPKVQGREIPAPHSLSLVRCGAGKRIKSSSLKDRCFGQFREDANPTQPSRLSPQKLLTFRSYRSKSPTQTRSPLEERLEHRA